MKKSPKNRVILFLSFVMTGALLVSCSDKKAQMVLTFSPPDANVTVDGYRPSSLESPHTFDFYKPGSYTLEVSAPGYTPVRLMVAVEAGELLEQTVHLVKNEEIDETPNLIAVSQDPARPDADAPPPANPAPPVAPNNAFELSVTSNPPGATVTAETSDKKSVLVFKTPGVRSLAKGHPWFITVSLDGYESVKRTVVAPAGDTGVHLGVTLEQKKNGASSTGKMPIPTPVQQLDDPPLDTPPTIAEPVQQRPRTLLTVQTTPATVVSLDGKVIGTSPIRAYAVKPGLHKILMENRDLGKRKVISKRFASGEHIRVIQYLDSPNDQ